LFGLSQLARKGGNYSSGMSVGNLLNANLTSFTSLMADARAKAVRVMERQKYGFVCLSADKAIKGFFANEPRITRDFVGCQVLAT
jgi:hypothetical protein